MSTCKTCAHWNTEPFATQCDGVTAVEGDPQMGCCMSLGGHNGCTKPETACRNWTARLVSVCMTCHHLIGPDQRPAGIHLPAGSIISHGLCLDCAPAHLKWMGLTDQETARVLNAATINTPLQRGATANQKPETVSTVSHLQTEQ